MTVTDTHRAIDAVWRIEAPRLIAGLARIVRDVGLAEELAQDALVTALEQWPDAASRAIPAPGSWPRPSTARSTCSAATSMLERKHAELAHEIEARAGDDAGRARRGARRRRSATTCCGSIFTACHPVLSDRGARRADAAPARRPHDRRDRARVPGAGADDRAADRPRQAHAGRGAACRSRCRAAPSSPSGCRRCSR